MLREKARALLEVYLSPRVDFPGVDDKRQSHLRCNLLGENARLCWLRRLKLSRFKNDIFAAAAVAFQHVFSVSDHGDATTVARWQYAIVEKFIALRPHRLEVWIAQVTWLCCARKDAKGLFRQMAIAKAGKYTKCRG